jgi:hypothetical protein
MRMISTYSRRRFESDWDEIQYLYHKLLYWLWQRQDRRRALRYCGRLETLLPKASPDHRAILGEACWSLVAETRGDLPAAIRYRENEIRLIKRLRRISARSPVRDEILRGYGLPDLSDQLDVLAILNHNAGRVNQAIRILHQSERLCKAHGLRFDGRDLLKQYLAETHGVRDLVGKVR